MGFVKESPIPADGVELLKAHGMYNDWVADMDYWAADRERDIYLFVTKWWGLAYDFAETYHMLFEGYVISFVRQTFWTVKDSVWEGKRLVEVGESEMDIRDLSIPLEMRDRQDDILKAIEEGVTALSMNRIITIKNIF